MNFAFSYLLVLPFVVQSQPWFDFSEFDDDGSSGHDYSIFDDSDVLNDIESIQNSIMDNANNNNETQTKQMIFGALSLYFRKYHYDFMSGLSDFGVLNEIDSFEHDSFDDYQYPVHERMDKGFTNAFIHYNQLEFPELNANIADHVYNKNYSNNVHSIMSHIHDAIHNMHYDNDHDNDEIDENGNWNKLFAMFDANNDGHLSASEYQEMSDAIDNYNHLHLMNDDGDEWRYSYSYNGVDYAAEAFWQFNNDYCDSHLYPYQSPIDIVRSELVVNNTIKINGWYWEYPFNFSESSNFQWNVSFNSHNTWHLVPINKYEKSELAVVSYFGFNNVGFIMSHMDIHYGRNNNEGSEHLIDGKAFPLELQYVFFSSYFDSLEQAINRGLRSFEMGEDATRYRTIAIVSIMFEVSDDANYVNRAMKRILNVDSSEQVMIPIDPKEINPTNMSIANTTISAYHYPGSFTTPDCLPIVNWFIIKETKMIGKTQMKHIHDFTNNGHNFRSVQRSYDHNVYDFTKPNTNGMRWKYNIREIPE